MAVTILERPEGQVLNNTGVSALVSSTYGTGDATFGSAAHGLQDGDYVYIESNIEDYNGFWYVDVTGTDTFKVYRYSGGEAAQYIQDAHVTYYVSELTHGWSAVHLPITYRLSSDLYPTNNVDTVRNVTSASDLQGYVVINLSGSLGDVTSYDYLYLNTLDADIDGVYQIIELISPTVLIINLAYDSSIDFTGATAQRYYNNYTIKVRVYSGIGSGHDWQSQKPIRLLTTLEIIPDENNEVFFSVNEIIKSMIETKNNPLIGTQPNNIDFWTQFYISVAESYDDSDGYSLGTYTSDFSADAMTFLGNAVNAKLEFKNQYSGFMSEYLMGPTAGKFLTPFNQPVLFSGIYQDISFIKSLENDYILNKQFYLNGVVGLLEQQTISGDVGIYRIPIEANCDYDRVDIWLTSDLAPDIEPATGELIITGYAPTVEVGPA